MLRTIHRAALLSFLIAPALSAQASSSQSAPPAAGMTHPSRQPQAGKPTLDAELTEHFKGITLTEEQVAKIVAAKARHHGAMETISKGSTDPADAATKAALQKHMEAEHAEFKALLTPEQVKIFERNMEAHHKAEMGGAKHDMSGGMKADPKATPRKPRDER